MIRLNGRMLFINGWGAFLGRTAGTCEGGWSGGWASSNPGGTPACHYRARWIVGGHELCGTHKNVFLRLRPGTTAEALA